MIDTVAVPSLLRITGIYALYTRRLRGQVLAGRLPGHVGLIMDGNRRWARQAGLANPSLGHRAGAEHVERVLSWCEAVGVRNITVFLCSTENLQHRDNAEVAYLMRMIEDVVAARLARPEARWQVHVDGRRGVPRRLSGRFRRRPPACAVRGRRL
jgi:short-chain Z-isoprenyl diphosphate synthase